MLALRDTPLHQPRRLRLPRQRVPLDDLEKGRVEAVARAADEHVVGPDGQHLFRLAFQRLHVLARPVGHDQRAPAARRHVLGGDEGQRRGMVARLVGPPGGVKYLERQVAIQRADDVGEGRRVVEDELAEPADVVLRAGHVKRAAVVAKIDLHIDDEQHDAAVRAGSRGQVGLRRRLRHRRHIRVIEGSDAVRVVEARRHDRFLGSYVERFSQNRSSSLSRARLQPAVRLKT